MSLIIYSHNFLYFCLSHLQSHVNLIVINNVYVSLVKTLSGAVADGVSKKFSVCSFICLHVIYQLSGPMCKFTWRYISFLHASHLHFMLSD